MPYVILTCRTWCWNACSMCHEQLLSRFCTGIKLAGLLAGSVAEQGADLIQNAKDTCLRNNCGTFCMNVF